MRTISVREMKARWSEIEAMVRDGETYEVLNRGKPTVRISPARPRDVVKWEDHLATAAVGKGRSAADLVRDDRDGRW
jgi:antitoxin (DNA-binding transcriptional repressor) of toxin-antitoxin stability system